MYTVYRVATIVKYEIFSSDSWKECVQFCRDKEWHIIDENGFDWDLMIV